MRQEETIESLTRSLAVERGDLELLEHDIHFAEMRLAKMRRDRDRIHVSIRGLERRLEERQIRDSYAEIEIAYLELKATLSLDRGETS